MVASVLALPTLLLAWAPLAAHAGELSELRNENGNDEHGNGNDDGSLRLHETTVLASHNAHANLAAAEGFLEPLGANQDDAMYDQMETYGVRALLLDLMYNGEEHPQEPLRLVHANSFIQLDYGGFRTGLGANLIPFLEEHDDAVVTLFLEFIGDVGPHSATVRPLILDQLKDIFSSMTVNGVALREMTFKYDHPRWEDHDDWPTLDEIRSSGQRLFVFTDRSDFIDAAFGFVHNRQALQENDWQGIDDCTARHNWGSGRVSLPSNDAWTRLFFMNHFCCGSGPEAKAGTVGTNLIGGGNNGWGIVYPRIQQCMASNGGSKPNFIALDWVSQSEDAREIVDYLNFGGRIGTGQTCAEDSHCATSSCNVASGTCQCQRCPPPAGAGVCLGCVVGQYCEDGGGEEANACLYKEGWPRPPPNADGPPSAGPSVSPTPSPVVSNQYCGADWETTVATCNTATKCPRGNVDCPEGETCFANLDDCPAAPTLSPSVGPSDVPSPIPSVSLRPIAGWSGVNLPTPPVAEGGSWTSDLGLTRPPAPPTAEPSSTPTKSPFDFSNRNFCGANWTDALENCYTNAPCPTGSPAACGGGTCYNGIVCEAPPTVSPTVAPTPPPTPPPNGGGPGGRDFANEPQGSPSETNNDPWGQNNGEDFDLSNFENPPSGAARWANGFVSGMIVLPVAAAIGYAILPV